jgi:hypothetical protein
VEEFAAAGGDLKSAATPVWMNLMGAFEKLAEGFGHEIAKSVKKSNSGKGTQLQFGGNHTSDCLTVGASAKVTADIIAGEVVVYGTIKGKLQRKIGSRLRRTVPSTAI